MRKRQLRRKSQKNNIKKYIQNNKGFETIELTILLPLLLFVFFSGFSYTLAIFARIGVADATNKAARGVALNFDINSIDESAADKVKKFLRDYRLGEEFEVEVRIIDVEGNEYDTDDLITGEKKYVKLTTTYEQPSIFPFLPRLIGQGEWADTHFHLNLQSTYRIEAVAGS